MRSNHPALSLEIMTNSYHSVTVSYVSSTIPKTYNTKLTLS